MSDNQRGAAAETCGCGHAIGEHEPNGPCTQWWRYPDVLEARRCGCLGVWVRRVAKP